MSLPGMQNSATPDRPTSPTVTQPGGTVVSVTYESLPLTEFAFPGPLRDALVSAVLGGQKVATASLQRQYDPDGTPLPVPGQQSVVVDSNNRPVAVIEITSVAIVRLSDVGALHAVDEGEGFSSVAEWRAAHERLWHGDEMRRALGDPTFTIDDDTLVVLERFRVVERVDGAPTDRVP
jgi:uncharacterized protein YhfF